MKKITNFTSIDHALERLIQSTTVKPSVEEVITKESYSRVLAEDLYSPKNLPSSDISHMDGYAIKSSDVKEHEKVKLKVVGFIGPGQRSSRPLYKGEAFRIMTGGALPEGADAVVPQEVVNLEGDYVEVAENVKPGSYVDPAGGDVRVGSLLFKAGHTLRAQDVGLLLALGIRKVKVYSKPKVAVLAIGSELTDVEEQVAKGKVFNSHTWVVTNMTKAAGAEASYIGLVKDDAEEIASVLSTAIKDYDVILTIGGSSVGDVDMVEQSLYKVGKVIDKVHGLKLQPGRVGGFAVVDGVPIIFLPGLIQSTVNVYVFLAYPLIRRLLGKDPVPYSLKIPATMSSSLKFTRWVDFKKVVWVRVSQQVTNNFAEPVVGESSKMSVITRSDGYVVVPEGKDSLHKDEAVTVNIIPGTSFY